MPYQPTWQDGQVTAEGERDCADRYNVIANVLNRHGHHSFSALDIGSAEGYFATRLSSDFDCSVTAIDPNPKLQEAADRNSAISVVAQRVDAAKLRSMERHDIVLALSVLHHMDDWPQVLDQIQACRSLAIIEVPHPDERWMRSAKARHQLKQIHDAVAGRSIEWLGEFERTGRDGSKHMRPMFLIRGNIKQLDGVVFSGSGTCSRKLTPALHAHGLDKVLGYQPIPGSLNLRCDDPIRIGNPAINWPGKINSKRRPYWFWDAWVRGIPCHAMIPATRGHGPECIELVAPFRLRDRLALSNGDRLALEVSVGQA